MLEARTIKRYGEYETVWIHVEDCGDFWVVTHSRYHASGAKVLGMQYDKDYYPTAESCIPNYIDICESYYSI